MTDAPPGLLKTLSYRNIGEVRDQGLELSLHSRWSEAVDTTVTWTWQDEPHAVDSPGPVNRPPHHLASFRRGFGRGRWRGSFGATWTDRAFWSDAGGLTGFTKSFLLAQGGLAVGFGPDRRVALALQATNVFDEAVQQHLLGDVIRRKATLEVGFRF
jgi:hypothetical protein